MNTRGSFHYPILLLSAILFLLLSACQPAVLELSLPTEQPHVQPTAQPVTLATQAPAEPTSAAPEGNTTGEITGTVTADYSAVAQNMKVEIVPAVTAAESESVPLNGYLPQYTLVTLEGYPVANHKVQPQIFLFPAGELAPVNENAGKNVTDLQALLKTQQAGAELPFLPLINAKQDFHAQVQYLDFKNGQGVRFLTQFNQGPVMINNELLIYTFQGLTSDGKYYVAAVLPVTNPELPAGSTVDEKLLGDWPGYLNKTATMLGQQPAATFTPDLSKLDALVRSIEVK